MSETTIKRGDIVWYTSKTRKYVVTKVNDVGQITEVYSFEFKHQTSKNYELWFNPKKIGTVSELELLVYEGTVPDEA